MATQVAKQVVPLGSSDVVTAAVVSGCERIAFLGRLFGGFKYTVEARVYATFEDLSPRAPRGVWQFVQLSNGGGYLRPVVDKCRLSTRTQWFAPVSADVAGVVTTIAALEVLRRQYRAEGIFGMRLSQLRDFARTHQEGAVIAYLLMA